MTILNDLHPNELFRFMHVRGPQRAPAGEILRYFVHNVYDQLSKTQLAAIKTKITTLYPTLITRIGSAKQLSEQMADVAKYKKSKEYISSPDDYQSRFELTPFLEWLDVNSSATTTQAVRKKFNGAVPIEMNAYVKSDEYKTLQCVLWDNLIASLLSPNDAFLVTLACKYLAGLHLVDVVTREPESDKPHTQLSYIYHAKPLVPKWVFEVFSTVEKKSDEGVGDQKPGNDNVDILLTRFNEVNQAIQDVRMLITKRVETQRQELPRVPPDILPVKGIESAVAVEKGQAELSKISDVPNNVKNPFELASSEQGVLSAEANQLGKQFFSEGGVLTLDIFLETLLGEAMTIANKLGSQEREYSVRVGYSIISRKDVCAEMIDRDPCAIRPRKEFASRGSFMNSALIGDLLITKQQLIKYDTGEVAHVEAVMQGLEKERTHRRLNRTETTTTFERESINESERESATNERFNLEKETAKTLKQDFQIKTGTNVSGKYGVVNFGASLDSSFGVSQTQSQQTATSFSKEVTNRALFRVKETVREMQTITVINEVEETSLHKLKNNTGDHVNGVYCWLDKFYINKIINYGCRLMLEFTAPEPANNYIFSKMAKPKTGAVVEKPAPPSEVVGPDGNKLTSPAVLTDVNYAFWVAQYEAANVSAPPKEYIWVSRSFKNEYPSSQRGDIYDAFTAAIAIDEGYETVSANASVYNFIWGRSTLFGMVATTPFGAGSTNNILLPNIRTSLGVSLLSEGMLFHMQIAVKLRRTDESYNNWKLDAYGKIIEAYKRKQQAYDEWLNAQYADMTLGFAGSGNNPEINRATEREELKKRCLELFTGQRFESFDAATNGIQNVSGYPEILFREAITEGNLVKFFEQAFEWEHMTYIFYPYFWGRKEYWPTIMNLEDASDPLFQKFLQAGYSRVNVPVRPGFENFVLIFNLLSNFVSSFGCSWNFAPSIFGALGISNQFIPGINDPVYMSVTQELIAAAGLNEETGTIIGHYVQKVPTNVVYVVPTAVAPGAPLPGLPDNTADPEIQPYI